ncbi:calcium-binding protein [Moraxella sp. ZY210820]|uniref:calcium-binding protein n=1 Tax=unclassified Moraxella TaxID=2685852 RepID=UPI00272F3231|nr:calcium-binding protein [Moraxella sp. ZY210820]WLF84388.1 hypothetical protein LU301_02560 [Moraxella sp. ZY210820]
MKLTAQVVFETSLKYFNDNKLIEKTKHKYPDIVQIEMLAIQVHNMKVNLETLQSSQFSRHPEFNKIKINLKEQIADLQTAVQLLADDKGININVKHDDLTTTLDKLVGQGYGKLFNESMDKLFKYNDYIKLVYNTFDEKLSSDTSKQVDYVKDVLNLSSKLSGGAFVDGSAGLLYGAKQGAISLSSIIQSEGLKHLESLAQKIPTISAKGVVGILSRGVITGILTDLSYKGGYAFGELVFKEGFKAVLGKELYEMENFITVMDSIYSFIFQDLTGDKLNAVIVFNTLLLGNFINAQGQSVITEDTTILLGSDDYKEMDFNKALKNYKAIYKLISGKDDADNISNEFSMLAHMEKSYELFKTLKGQKLIIAQNSDDIKAFSKIALEDSASSFAYRYAIVNLNLFVLEGIDYSKHNKNGELELYDTEKHPDGLTEIYLSKRAEMLSIILDKANGKFQTSQYSYQDLEKDIVINETSLDTRYGNVDVYNENTQIIFGGEDSDTITAEDIGDKHNFLFGGKGDDRISAGEGRDYLEGNSGNDVLEGGDGDDTLWGGTGNDRLYGDSITPDGILGFGESQGNDVLVGGQGNDTFYGGKGSDKLIDLEGVDMYNAKLKETTSYYHPLFKMKGEDDIYDKDGRGLIFWYLAETKTDCGEFVDYYTRVKHGKGSTVKSNWFIVQGETGKTYHFMHSYLEHQSFNFIRKDLKQGQKLCFEYFDPWMEHIFGKTYLKSAKLVGE